LKGRELRGDSFPFRGKVGMGVVAAIHLINIFVRRSY